MYLAQSEVIDDTVCLGGGKVSDDKQAKSDEYHVYCFNMAKDKWLKLTRPLPVRLFGLGKVKGTLVAIGGVNKNDEESVKTYKYRNSDWIESPKLSMQVPRHSPSVSSVATGLIIIGGNPKEEQYFKTIEIYRSDRDQWLHAKLPVQCLTASTAVFDDTLFVVCNKRYPLYADVTAVINEGVQRFEKPISSNSVWKILEETPTFNPSPAILLGHLYLLGGRSESEEGAIQKKVYSMNIMAKKMFPSLDNLPNIGISSSTWMDAGDMFEPLTDTCVVMSHESIKLLGGKSSERGLTDRVYVGQPKMFSYM